MSAKITAAVRTEEIFRHHLNDLHVRVDRMFAGLMVGQWILAILIAVFVSPKAWPAYGAADPSRSAQSFLYTAIFLGGFISSVPIALAYKQPGTRLTRYVIASAQVLWSALLIHLTGGRIETHFHTFGSLAFLAFYRDYTVLIPATIVITTDHMLRQLFWPQSVFGVTNPESWRFLEHAAWVLFEDVFLALACLRGTRELRSLSRKQAELEQSTRMEHDNAVKLDAALTEAVPAREAAERANRVKAQFLANMSHELRTPINGVVGMTDLISRTNLNGKQRQYIDTMRGSGETLLTVVNDILDFAKIEAGKLTIDVVELKLYDVVHEISDRLAASAHAKGLELICMVDPDIPEPLLGDSDRIKQVLSNLIANAIKFTPQGEVVIRVRRVDDSAGDALIRVDVSDTGIGIAESDVPKLFVAFSQVDNSNSRKYGGTGLGLAITKQLVELMGGAVGVSSQQGKGSNFWFTLRLTRPRPSRPELRLPDVVRSCRVLVVDDNDTNRQIIEEQILPWVAGVVTVESGRAGLEALARYAAAGKPFNLVITDMQMPEMDGVAFCRQAKAIAVGRGIPVIMLTSVSTLLSAEAAHAGVARCLTKPVRPDRLIQSMIAVLERRPDRRSKSIPPLLPAPAPTATSELATLDSGVRLLLAEDNVVNQEVALEMLAELGYKTDVVADGKQALEALAARPYAVILMDCQMPEMNGYQATQEIRKREGDGKKTPIIAVTAHAMIGDLEKALASGMNDYLTKPLTVAKLADVLHRWLPRTELPAASPRSATASPSSDRVLDPTMKRSQKVVELFLVQIPVAGRRLKEAIAEGNKERLQEEAHRLRGSCLSVGAGPLAKLCQQLEMAPETAAELVEELDNAVADLQRELEAEDRQKSGPTARMEPPKPDA